ncbi:unnamed protein product, partial [Protopolystoma xenopodis]
MGRGLRSLLSEANSRPPIRPAASTSQTGCRGEATPSAGATTASVAGLEPRGLQVLAPNKFLLGRVASNDDICIRTETPFAFSIASTGHDICITKVASADDLNPATGSDTTSAGVRTGIPVSLRLTFDSAPCVNHQLAAAASGRPPGLGRLGQIRCHDGDAAAGRPRAGCYRTIYHVDMPSAPSLSNRGAGESSSGALVPPQTDGPVRTRPRRMFGGDGLRYSMPCISYRADPPPAMPIHMPPAYAGGCLLGLARRQTQANCTPGAGGSGGCNGIGSGLGATRVGTGESTGGDNTSPAAANTTSAIETPQLISSELHALLS